jgi:hypothetical protein
MKRVEAGKPQPIGADSLPLIKCSVGQFQRGDFLPFLELSPEFFSYFEYTGTRSR